MSTKMPEETDKTCFVVMGFGKKTDFETGRTLDLDKSYRNIIKPAVEAAGLRCIRADEIVHSGLIDVPMYEQLLKANVVVADLSTSNKNAFYELGVRHALRPYTTVVIAEDGIKTFPFDVSHVAVRQYHHLGEDIGYDEVMRFRDLLTKAIVEITQQEPPAMDSPVYTFLNGLNPPAVAAAVQAAVQDTAPQGPKDATPRSIEGAAPDSTPTHSILVQQVDEAQGKGDFLKAKNLLSVIREMMKPQTPAQSEDPYIVQRLALVTYKAKYPSEEKSLYEAHDIVQTLNPGTSNDPETLGLWGSVHKRLWEITKSGAFLDEAVRAYERGFYLRNDYYNGINFAFLLNVRAANAVDPADAIADFVLARRVRKEVLTICKDWLASNPAPVGPAANEKVLKQYQKSRYWVLATMAEAHLGLGEPEQSQHRLEQAIAGAPEPWMKEATQEQCGKLENLQKNSPLRYLKTEDATH